MKRPSLMKHLAHVRTSGTIVRSSPFLIQRMLRPIRFARARVIVQLGVGTACITRDLLERMRGDARLIAVELNPEFVEEGRRIQDPRLTVVEACASTLPGILEAHGIAAADYVVSSLPLAIIDKAKVDRILEVSADALADGGLFMQYQYSLSQKDVLEKHFADVRVGFTLVNIPPAFVYECTPVREPQRAVAGA